MFIIRFSRRALQLIMKLVKIPKCFLNEMILFFNIEFCYWYFKTCYKKCIVTMIFIFYYYFCC